MKVNADPMASRARLAAQLLSIPYLTGPESEHAARSLATCNPLPCRSIRKGLSGRLSTISRDAFRHPCATGGQPGRTSRAPRGSVCALGMDWIASGVGDAWEVGRAAVSVVEGELFRIDSILRSVVDVVTEQLEGSPQEHAAPDASCPASPPRGSRCVEYSCC